MRFWDLLHLHGNRRLMLHQRPPCSVRSLIRAEKEVVLRSSSDGRIWGYVEGYLGTETVLASLSYELVKKTRAASAAALGSMPLYWDTKQKSTEGLFCGRHSCVRAIMPGSVTAQVSHTGLSWPVSQVIQNWSEYGHWLLSYLPNLSGLGSAIFSSKLQLIVCVFWVCPN